jgi:hypothetical protein
LPFLFPAKAVLWIKVQGTDCNPCLGILPLQEGIVDPQAQTTDDSAELNFGNTSPCGMFP